MAGWLSFAEREAIENRSRLALAAFAARTRRAAGSVADFLWGQDCVACGSDVDSRVLFCDRCRDRIEQASPPWCPRCALPYASEPSHLCLRCRASQTFVASIRVRWLYKSAPFPADPVASAIRRFKYGGCRRLGPRLADELVPLVQRKEYDLVVPVPLHPARLRKRGFNQAAILAASLARRCALTCDLFALVRSRPTPPQVGSRYEERMRNVAGAFSVACPQKTARARVLVVDDVVTSGATVDACGRALMLAGAERVDAVALARTAR